MHIIDIIIAIIDIFYLSYWNIINEEEKRYMIYFSFMFQTQWQEENKNIYFS